MKNLPRISDAEWSVMEIVWEKAPQTANQIVDALQPRTRWNPKTIKTLINRLVNKGALTYEKEGRTFLYAPAVPQPAMEQRLVGGLIQGAFRGSARRLILRALESGETSREELDSIKQLIAEYEANAEEA
jgi:BlaI family penicillinase repressor